MRTSTKRALSSGIGGVMLAYMLIGFLMFPNSPYKRCPSGFCDKTGQTRSEIEYRENRLWERSFFAIWAAGLLAIVFLNRKAQP